MLFAEKKKNSRKKTCASVTVTMVRDRKIRTALRTNQIEGFVTVPAWKKIRFFINIYYPQMQSEIQAPIEGKSKVSIKKKLI